MDEPAPVLKSEKPSWLQRNRLFLAQNRRELHNSDHILKAIHNRLPLSIQHGVRDVGALRLLADSSVAAAAPILLSIKPKTILRLASLLETRQVLRYGPHEAQTIDFFASADESQRERPTLVFVHGGAWGSGKPWMYWLVVDTFLALGFGRVAVVGYRTYPTAGMEAQVQDVEAALSTLGASFLARDVEGASNRPRRGALAVDTVLCGHSSGAHLVSTVALRSQINRNRWAASKGDQRPQSAEGGGSPPLSLWCGLVLRGVVTLSGPFDLVRHHHFEAKRGGHVLSPMAAAALSSAGLASSTPQSPHLPPQSQRISSMAERQGPPMHHNSPGLFSWTQPTLVFGPHEDMAVPAALWKCSPSRLARLNSSSSDSSPSMGSTPAKPSRPAEHDHSSSGVTWLLVHGCSDVVAPFGQSVDFAAALQSVTEWRVRTLWLQGVDHHSFMPIMFPPPGAVETAVAAATQNCSRNCAADGAGGGGGVGEVAPAQSQESDFGTRAPHQTHRPHDLSEGCENSARLLSSLALLAQEISVSYTPKSTRTRVPPNPSLQSAL